MPNLKVRYYDISIMLWMAGGLSAIVIFFGWGVICPSMFTNTHLFTRCDIITFFSLFPYKTCKHSILCCHFCHCCSYFDLVQENPPLEEEQQQPQEKMPLCKTNVSTSVISLGRHPNKNYRNSCPRRGMCYEPTFSWGMMVVRRVVPLWNMQRSRRHMLPWRL